MKRKRKKMSYPCIQSCTPNIIKVGAQSEKQQNPALAALQSARVDIARKPIIALATLIVATTTFNPINLKNTHILLLLLLLLYIPTVIISSRTT